MVSGTVAVTATPWFQFLSDRDVIDCVDDNATPPTSSAPTTACRNACPSKNVPRPVPAAWRSTPSWASRIAVAPPTRLRILNLFARSSGSMIDDLYRDQYEIT